MSFQSDLAYGKQGELFVLKKLHYKYPKAYKVEGYCKEWDLFVPEKNIGVEVKSDRATHKTGNVVIENKYGGAPSGIETTKATWWAYITKNNLYWITPDKIKEPGFVLSWPAYFGAVPCVASKTAFPFS